MGLEDLLQTRVKKDDLLRSIGIATELAVFVTKFLERPDRYFSISFEARCGIDNKIDAVLSSFVCYLILCTIVVCMMMIQASADIRIAGQDTPPSNV